MSQSTTCASALSNTSACQPGASQDSKVDFVDLARDVFIRHVNDYANFDDSSVGKIRSDLFDIASNRDDFPTGSLKTRRNRRAEESIGNKLAADCHALCMFILGGPLRTYPTFSVLNMLIALSYVSPQSPIASYRPQLLGTRAYSTKRKRRSSCRPSIALI